MECGTLAPNELSARAQAGSPASAESFFSSAEMSSRSGSSSRRHSAALNWAAVLDLVDLARGFAWLVEAHECEDECHAAHEPIGAAGNNFPRQRRALAPSTEPNVCVVHSHEIKVWRSRGAPHGLARIVQRVLEATDAVQQCRASVIGVSQCGSEAGAAQRRVQACVELLLDHQEMRHLAQASA